MEINMKILIGADLVPTRNTAPDYVKWDIRKLFGKVCDIAKDYDRFIVNLECALTESENRIKKFGPNIKGPIESAKTISALGITEVALANNHVFDFGIEGLNDTIKALNEAGIPYFGIGENDTDSRKPYFIESKNKKIAIINVCEHEYTYALPNRSGANPFDPLYSLDHIHALKEQCDFVFVLYHGGKEFYRYPSPEVQRICRRMVDKGADLVVTQHTHCIGCREDYLSGVIIYGQGNFIFDQGDILSEDDMALTTSMLLLHVIVEGNKLFVKEIPMTLEKNYIKIPDNNMYDELIQEYEKYLEYGGKLSETFSYNFESLKGEGDVWTNLS